MKNKFITFAGFTFIAFITLALPFSAVLAQNVPTCPEGTYCALSTIPGITQTGKPADPTFIITNIYGISIGIAAILAIGMIIWAGIQYATTEAISGKSEAKKHWQGAVFGLLLLLGSYLILRTINVDLVNQDLSLNSPIGCVETLNGNRVPCGAGAEDAQLQQAKAKIAQEQAAAKAVLDAAEEVVKTKELAYTNALEQGLPDEDLNKLEADLNAAQNAVTLAQANTTKTGSFRAVVDTSVRGVASFERSKIGISMIELNEQATQFRTESNKLILGMKNVKNANGTNVFTDAEISNVQTQLGNQSRYMSQYIAWREGGKKGLEPQRPTLNLTPTE